MPPKTHTAKEPFFSYAELLFDMVWTILGSVFLAWLNVPNYAIWIIVAVFILAIIGAKVFGRTKTA